MEQNESQTISLTFCNRSTIRVRSHTAKETSLSPELVQHLLTLPKAIPLSCVPIFWFFMCFSVK